jgi:DNA-binding CsgD family transcriptional regulator/PAS domain-containing protein
MPLTRQDPTSPARLSESGTAQASPDVNRRFVAAVEAIYDAAPDPSLWPQALSAITDHFGDVGTIMMWRRTDGRFGTIVSPSLAAAQKDYEENKGDLRDLPAQRLMEHGYLLHSDTAVDYDVISQHEIETHPFYTEFSARHGIRWHTAIAVAPDPEVAVWIALQRGPDKKPYSESELVDAAQLGRHIEKSLRLSIRLFDSELTNLGLGEALGRVNVGVFALDSQRRVIFSNAAAKALVGREIEIVQGQLRLGTGAERAQADAALARTADARPDELSANPKPILLRRAAPQRPLVVYVLPSSPRGVPEHFLTNTRNLVLVIEPKPHDPADPAIVRDLLGLTLGEARISALIAAGIAPRKVSEQLGITEETVRTVLKRVYAKVGVSRQNELTALLSRLVMT